MHLRHTISLLGLLCAAVTPVAFGQIETESYFVHGQTFDEEALFTYTLNLATDTLTIKVDNQFEKADDVHGTIAAFGFNTPFTDAQLGNQGSNVTLTTTWNHKNSSHNPGSWSKEEPFSFKFGATTYKEDLGVYEGGSASNPSGNNGIEYGEIATFTFQFKNLDINLSNYQGFFDSTRDIVVYWQDIDPSCFTSYCDIGWADLPPAPEPSTYGLFGAAGLLGLVALRRHSAKRAAAKLAA